VYSAARVKPVGSLAVIQRATRGSGMRILIAGLVMCVAGCSNSYENGPLGYSKRVPIERAEPSPDHSSPNAENQRQMGLQLQNSEYKARTTPMLGPAQ
jgi:hypothetical protein